MPDQPVQFALGVKNHEIIQPGGIQEERYKEPEPAGSRGLRPNEKAPTSDRDGIEHKAALFGEHEKSTAQNSEKHSLGEKKVKERNRHTGHHVVRIESDQICQKRRSEREESRDYGLFSQPHGRENPPQE